MAFTTIIPDHSEEYIDFCDFNFDKISAISRFKYFATFMAASLVRIASA